MELSKINEELVLNNISPIAEPELTPQTKPCPACGGHVYYGRYKTHADLCERCRFIAYKIHNRAFFAKYFNETDLSFHNAIGKLINRIRELEKNNTCLKCSRKFTKYTRLCRRCKNLFTAKTRHSHICDNCKKRPPANTE